MEQWETLLASYKTDTAAGYAEITRAEGVYTTKKAAGDMAGAEAAHTWANQIRAAMGISGQYNATTGALLPTSSANPAVVPQLVSPTVVPTTNVPVAGQGVVPQLVSPTVVPTTNVPATLTGPLSNVQVNPNPKPTATPPAGFEWTQNAGGFWVLTGIVGWKAPTPTVITPVQTPIPPVQGAPTVTPTVTPTPTPVYTPPPAPTPTPLIPPSLSPTAAITGSDVGTAVTTAANDPAYVYAQNTLIDDVTLLGQFLAENPWANKDNTQWDRATIDAFTTWSDNWVTMKATEAQAAGIQFDATKEPWWPSYVAMLTARDDLTKVSLKTALDLKTNAINQQSADVAANYKFQIAEIDNALNLANWASGQELAASGVILVGMLSWALTANEAKGINEKALAGADRTNYLNKLANDITILTSDYADNGTAIDKATITEIAAQRMLFLTGNQAEYDKTMALAATLKGQRSAMNIAAPGIAKETRAAEVTTKEQANLAQATTLAQLAQSGITLTKNTDGTYNWEVGLSTDQKLTRDQIIFDQWYKVEGLKLDQATLASQQGADAFQQWATQQGITLDWAKFDWGKTVDTAQITLAQAQFDWGKVVDTAGMTLASATFDWNKVVAQAGMDLNNEEFAFTKWYQTEGINLSKAQLALDTTKNTFYEWATRQGIALDKATFDWNKYVDQKNIDLAAAQQKFTEWYQSEGLKLSKSQLASDQAYQQFQEWATLQGITLDLKQFNWSKQVGTWAHEADLAGGGAGGAGVYDPSDDRALVNSANFQASGPGSAPYLRLGAYSGAMTGSDAAIESFVLGGTTKAVVKLFDKNGKPSLDANGQQKTQQVDQAFTGLKDLAEGDARDVISLVQDPLRAGEAWAMWCGLNIEGTTTAGIFRAYAAAIDPTTGKPQLTTSQLNAGLKFLSTWRTTPGQGGGQP